MKKHEQAKPVSTPVVVETPKKIVPKTVYFRTYDDTHPQGNDQASCLRRAIENSYNIRERGFNNGKEVRELQAYTGNKPPAPYCGSGVCKLAGDCGIPNPKSAWSPTVAKYGKLVYKRTSTSLSALTYPENIKIPLVASIYTSSKGRVTHVFFALATDGRMTRTGEFNTSGSRKGYGSSDGDGFHFLYRPNEQIWSLRDWIN
jgi:hypothetical protein